MVTVSDTNYGVNKMDCRFNTDEEFRCYSLDDLDLFLNRVFEFYGVNQ